MAAVTSYTSTFIQHSSICKTSGGRFCFFKPLKPRIKALSPGKIRAHSTTIIETEPGNISTEKVGSINKTILACPICYNPLKCNSGSESAVESTSGSSFQCGTCKKSYFSNEVYLDLTVASGAKEYAEFKPALTEIFRTPLVSFLYERGWRQNFVWGGFPGPEKEFEMAKEYLNPTIGGNIVDASCGGGLFSRLFAKSGLFSLVIALDFSENMLRQSYEFVKQEKSFPKENLTLQVQKYWVESSGHNCFMLFPRSLFITWGEDKRYWHWPSIKESSTSGEEVVIEVAELLNVCWLDVRGKVDTSYLSPGVKYEVVFVVMLKDRSYGWEVPVNLRLEFPANGTTQQQHKVNILQRIKPISQWIELHVGEFQTPPSPQPPNNKHENKAEIQFSMFEYEGGQWKRGLVIKGVIIRPKN